MPELAAENVEAIDDGVGDAMWGTGMDEAGVEGAEMADEDEDAILALSGSFLPCQAWKGQWERGNSKI